MVSSNAVQLKFFVERTIAYLSRDPKKDVVMTMLYSTMGYPFK